MWKARKARVTEKMVDGEQGGSNGVAEVPWAVPRGTSLWTGQGMARGGVYELG